jgi:hypothetical protein
MTNTEKLQFIYDKEINFVLSCHWDGGFFSKLGQEGTREYDRCDEGNFNTIDEAIEYIYQCAKELK